MGHVFFFNKNSVGDMSLLLFSCPKQLALYRWAPYLPSEESPSAQALRGVWKQVGAYEVVPTIVGEVDFYQHI